jgi:cyclopropane fatty-acyl-phospholipid synthase-like methyltransferase
MFWEKKLAQWVEDVKTKANLPARLVLWDGQQHDFGQFAAPQVTLHVKSATALPYLLEPSLDNLGEAYVKGKIDIEGKLSDIINIGYSLARNTVTSASKLARVRRYFNHSKSSDKKAIQYHYDVSNEFYKLWLDENMVYSCAYFENGDEDLANAQIKKIDHILTKIQLQPGQRLLDIGCGWGALVLRAASKFGAKCVGVTLSQNQFDLATARVKAAGLEDKIEIRLQDYRDVQGQFDRITSVGMFEHVGRKNLPGYFQKIRDLLVDDGIAMNHGITSRRCNAGASKRLTSKVCAVTMRVRSTSGRRTSKTTRKKHVSWSTTRNSASGACIWPAARMRSRTTTCRSTRWCAARPAAARRPCRGRAGICTTNRNDAVRRSTAPPRSRSGATFDSTTKNRWTKPERANSRC